MPQSDRQYIRETPDSDRNLEVDLIGSTSTLDLEARIARRNSRTFRGLRRRAESKRSTDTSPWPESN